MQGRSRGSFVYYRSTSSLGPGSVTFTGMLHTTYNTTGYRFYNLRSSDPLPSLHSSAELWL